MLLGILKSRSEACLWAGGETRAKITLYAGKGDEWYLTLPWDEVPLAQTRVVGIS